MLRQNRVKAEARGNGWMEGGFVLPSARIQVMKQASALHQVTASPPRLPPLQRLRPTLPPSLHHPPGSYLPAASPSTSSSPHCPNRCSFTPAHSSRIGIKATHQPPLTHTQTHSLLPPSVSLATAQQHPTACSPSSSSLHPSSGKTFQPPLKREQLLLPHLKYPTLCVLVLLMSWGPASD